MRKNYIKIFLTSAVLVAAAYGCKKAEKGFISDFMYYSPNPLIATQGNVTTSKSIELDGSTGPVHARLLAVRNKATGAAVPEMLTSYMIRQFTAEITTADSTEEMVNKKIVMKPSIPLTIGEIGGRIALSQATENVPIGLYVIDVEVSNEKGTRTITNACTIDLQVKSHFKTPLGPFFTTSDVAAETGFSSQSPLPMNITYDKNGPNKIIFKFLDKNGVAFDPSQGEVTTRGDRGHFAQMNPYFPLVKTNNSMEWGFLVLPNGFPIKEGNNGKGNYYRIPGRFTVENRNVNPVFFEFMVYSPGTFTLTVQIPTITRKP